MKLELKRTHRGADHSFGRLLIDGRYFCDTLEPADRNPCGHSGIFNKIPGSTAIPYGFYSVVINVVSPRFSKNPAYAFIGARMPRLLDVPHFDGILIHPGNNVSDTSGCILVGKRGNNATLHDSRATFFALYHRMEAAVAKGEEIDLTIVGGA